MNPYVDPYNKLSHRISPWNSFHNNIIHTHTQLLSPYHGNKAYRIQINHTQYLHIDQNNKQ